MKEDVWRYFQKKYRQADFQVVPGHWPDFKSTEAVDIWIDLMNHMLEDNGPEETTH